MERSFGKWTILPLEGEGSLVSVCSAKMDWIGHKSIAVKSIRAVIVFLIVASFHVKLGFGNPVVLNLSLWIVRRRVLVIRDDASIIIIGLRGKRVNDFLWEKSVLSSN